MPHPDEHEGDAGSNPNNLAGNWTRTHQYAKEVTIEIPVWLRSIYSNQHHSIVILHMKKLSHRAQFNLGKQ